MKDLFRLKTETLCDTHDMLECERCLASPDDAELRLLHPGGLKDTHKHDERESTSRPVKEEEKKKKESSQQQREWKEEEKEGGGEVV